MELVQDEKLVDDFLLVRKTKNATNSETALNGLIEECKKHNFDISEAVKICIDRDWKGFKVEWVKNLEQKNKQNGHTNAPGENQKPVTIGGIPQSQINSLLSKVGG